MKRLLIDYRGEAVRAACMTDGKLKELFIDHKKNSSLVGSIFNGVVKNILPSRFAFIDIGQEKNAFMNLPVGELSLKVGQYIPVQVRKDASGSKGPNVSDVLKFKGRLAIVSLSQSREIGVSGKISSKAERKRLQGLAASLLPRGYSCVIRTQGNGATKETIQAEFEQLCNLNVEIYKSAGYSPAPKLLYRDELILNDLLTNELEEIILNDSDAFSQFKKNAFVKCVRFWDENVEGELFAAFDLERQILKALQRNVWLPCGGFVTFDSVEACVVIDVNSGKFLGKKNYRETVLRVNIEAAQCIADQIALRNLSGMIIVDFIDMPEEEDKNKLLSIFGAALKQLRIPADIVGMTTLGLVQLTRRKQREPLSRLLQQSCPHCNGSGRVLTFTARGDHLFHEGITAAR